MEDPQKNQHWKEPLFWAIGLSLLLHILTPWKKLSLWTHFTPKSQTIEPIEITGLLPLDKKPTPKESPSKKGMEVAETEASSNKSLDPDAKYLSDRSQTAEKETRSRITDDFQKGGGTGPRGGPREAPEEMAQTENDANEINPNDVPLGTSQKPKDWKKLSLRDLGVGGNGTEMSASDDRLKGVEEGNRTILSTREFKYFAYYHRIKELLRQHWKPKIEKKLMLVWGRGKNPNDAELITRVLVLLDAKGGIQKISKIARSGYAEIDEAAVEAFEQAGPFPNPPKGLLDEDGYVRIHWDFILKMESSPSIQFRTVGSGGNRY